MNVVHFAAIDVDEYPLDHEKMALQIEQLGLPLIVCRSKSGGAHLYLFGEEPLSAKLVRQKFREWIPALQIKKFDLYPAQDELGEGIGNFINMPFFNDAHGNQYAVGVDGAMTIDAFCAAAGWAKTTEKDLPNPSTPRKHLA